MATVKLFGGLRDHAAGKTLEAPGETVKEVLEKLCDGRDGLQEAIFLENKLLPHVRVMVNGRDIELDQGLATTVGQGDQIAIFPPIAGGQK